MLINIPFEERRYSDEEAIDHLNAYLENANPPAEERAAITYLIRHFPQAGRYVDYAMENILDPAHFGGKPTNYSSPFQSPRKKPGDYHTWRFEWDVMTERMHFLADNERRAARIALAMLNRENTVSLYDLPRDPQELADLLSLLQGTKDTP